ncbi:gluconokinase [Acetobacter cibinongensis]|uniref:Gluconokinase n=1 Tax=Acetobacter cibinongensis TaxID=146475 RepID=A0A1Z5YSV1_9PROT|nr:gluconokinase [Acetobacter cibinongensis]OUJ01295.1 carbohydrate kinase [Acetobacter cibinongensis]
MQPGQPSVQDVRKSLLVVMGVSGSGKTTIAEGLHKELGWPFQEGDALHPQHNVQKMAAGIPLTDEDRLPWLNQCRAWLDQCAQAGSGAILTCSALKRSYRDVLRASGLDLIFIHLTTDHNTLLKRVTNRSGHYMPASLLPSQINTLEPPEADERALEVDATAPAADIIAKILSTLKAL